MADDPFKSRDDRDSRKEMKNMNFKEKREHIWAYYKLHIAVGVLLLITVGWALNHYWLNPPKKIWMCAATYNIYMEDDSRLELIERLTALIPEDELDKYEISVQTYIMNSTDMQYAMAQQMSFDALSVAGDIDILIVEPSSYDEEFAEAEYFESAAFYEDFFGPDNGAWVGIVASSKHKEAAAKAIELFAGGAE